MCALHPPQLRTGISSLDDIPFGGLPKGHVYLVEGDPGTGKTTLGMQFILEGKRAGERCLYVTLAESKTELEVVAQSHKWSLDGVSIAEFLPEEANLNGEDQYTVFHPSEVELAATIKKLIAEIERVNPERRCSVGRAAEAIPRHSTEGAGSGRCDRGANPQLQPTE